MRKGFTVVELLVTIGVIGVVVAILLPPLSWIRRAAWRTECAANVRTCLQAMAMYNVDFDDAFPMFARASYDDAFTNGGTSLGYYYQSLHWPMVLRQYVTDRPLERSQLCSRSPTRSDAFAGEGSYVEYLAQYPAEYVQPSEYRLSYTLFTDPAIWRPGGDVRDETLFRAVRASELVYPSQKGVLIEQSAYHLGSDAPSIIGDRPHPGPSVSTS